MGSLYLYFAGKRISLDDEIVAKKKKENRKISKSPNSTFSANPISKKTKYGLLILPWQTVFFGTKVPERVHSKDHSATRRKIRITEDHGSQGSRIQRNTPRITLCQRRDRIPTFPFARKRTGPSLLVQKFPGWLHH